MFCQHFEHGRDDLRRKLEAAEDCLHRSPSLDSALDIEVFAQICAKIRSWESFPLSGVVDFQTLIRYSLFRQNIDDYKTLRSHTLGYMALSAVGLTEPELIDLLSSDEEVTGEIRAQTEKNHAKTLANK